MKQQLQLTLEDLRASTKNWRIWLTLGYQDIQLRYRRSTLGPLWITITMAVFIYTIGFLYGMLFKMELHEYFPYLAGGIITWGLISSLIIESNNVFVESQNYIKQIKLPYSTYILRMLARNLIIFFHNLIALVPIIIYYHVSFGLVSIFFMFLGLLVILGCGLTFGTFLAMLGARFRDMQMIITTLVQVTFLLSPVMWMQSRLPEKYHFVADLNPINQLLNLVRAPLQGHLPSLHAYVVSLLLLSFGVLLMLYSLVTRRKRISFWV